MKLYIEWEDGTSREVPCYDFAVALETFAHEYRRKDKLPVKVRHAFVNDEYTNLLLRYDVRGIHETA